MNHTDSLESLRSQYFELSRAFLQALQSDQSSRELENIRSQIREIVARMEALESGGASDDI